MRDGDSISFGNTFGSFSGTQMGNMSGSTFGMNTNLGGTGTAYAILTSTTPGSQLLMEVTVLFAVLGHHGWGEARTNDGRVFKVTF